jgi:tetratricopeptide (TPR) repeat protein
MATFRPKEVFQKARDAEAKGEAREASSHYASLSVYLRRRGKDAEALTLIRRAVALAPHPRLYLQLALCSEIEKDSQSADAAMEKYVSAAIARQSVEKYRKVLEDVLESHPRLRQKFYDAVLVLDRTGTAAFLGRAQALRDQNDAEGALKVLLDGLRAEGDETPLLSEMKEILLAGGLTEDLAHLANYEKGKLSKENLAILLSAKSEKAASEVDSVEKPLNDLIADLEKEIGYSSGSAAAEIGPLLEEFKKRSRTVIGADSQAKLDMGLAYFEMGLLKEAIEEIDGVQEADPLFAQAQVLKGAVLIAQSSELGALECFQRSLRCSEKSQDTEKEARYQIVRVFHRLGDFRQAFAHAAELERMDENYRGLRTLKNQIQEAMERKAPR